MSLILSGAPLTKKFTPLSPNCRTTTLARRSCETNSKLRRTPSSTGIYNERQSQRQIVLGREPKTYIWPIWLTVADMGDRGFRNRWSNVVEFRA